MFKLIKANWISLITLHYFQKYLDYFIYPHYKKKHNTLMRIEHWGIHLQHQAKSQVQRHQVIQVEEPYIPLPLGTQKEPQQDHNL